MHARSFGTAHCWKCRQTAAKSGPGPSNCSALHYSSGHTRGGNSRIIDGGLRAQRTQPTSGKPCARNHELRPATIQANPNVRRRRHRGVTQRTRTVAIQPDFCRNDRYGGRLALGADHFHTSGGPKRTELPKRIEGVIQSNGIRGEISTGTLQKMNESNVHICGTETSFRDMKARLSDH